MIHVFNRREFRITRNMTELSKIRDILDSKHVEYTVKTGNFCRTSSYGGGAGARTGSFGMNSDAIYQYTVYVKKKDHEKACYLLGR